MRGKVEIYIYLKYSNANKMSAKFERLNWAVLMGLNQSCIGPASPDLLESNISKLKSGLDL